jgi:hypothetical protein
MSFDSNLEIIIIDGDPPDLEAVRPRILAQLDKDGIHPDVYADISDAFSQSKSHFRVHSSYLLQLMDAIANIVPDVCFDARGLGEEFRDTWIAEYRHGKRVFTQGPWEY